MNLYAYVQNDPVNYIDPWGLSSVFIDIARQQESATATIGTISLNGVEIGRSLELPWNDNKRYISRIPAGTYFAKIRPNSETSFNYDVIEILNVQDRDNIEMHKGNYPSDTEGCPLPGEEYRSNVEDPETHIFGDYVGPSGPVFNQIMNKIKQTQAIDRMMGDSTSIIFKITDISN